MKRVWTIPAAAFVFFAACASLYAADAKAPTKVPLPTIRGIVTDQHNKPIRNAQAFGVVCMRETPNYKDAAAERIVVGKDGRFTYKPKRTSDVDYYIVVAAADGYACGADYYRGERDQRKDLKITLNPGFTLKGTVVDENGKPVAGAKVEVKGCYGYNSGASSQNLPGNVAGLLAGVTDKRGKFAIARLLKPSDFGQYYLSLETTKKGRATVQMSFNRRDSTDEVTGGVTIKQPVECLAEGVLYLPGKSGTAPAGITIAMLGPSKYGWEPRLCTTDKNGKFRIGALPPGKTTIVSGPSWYQNRDGKAGKKQEPMWIIPAVVKDMTPKQLTRVELIAEPGATIKGRVKTKDGKPAKQARIIIQDRCSPTGGYASSWHSIASDDNGEFATRVAAGDARIAVQEWSNNWYNDSDMPAVSVKLADGDEKSDLALTVEETPQYTIAGFDYTKASKPIPDDFAIKPGVYSLSWDPEVDCSSAARSYTQMTDAKVKAALKGAPKLVSTKARYFACRIDGGGADGCLPIIVDESQGTGKGYDTAYIDYNRNWDLSDDKPVTFATPKGYRQIYTDYFSMPVRQREDGDKVSERPVQARLGVYGDGSDYVQAYVQTKGAWKGTVDSTDGKIECVVLDSSCNGVCGDITDIKENGDYVAAGDFIFFDTNGAGGVIMYPYGSHGAMLYRVTKIGSKFYNIKTSRLGDKVTIEPYTGGMGSLLVRGTDIQGLKADAGSLSVSGPNGSYTINKCSGKGISLPVGTYYINSCALLVKSADASASKMGCAMKSPVEVKADAQTTVNIGGKLTMAIDPTQKNLTWRPGQTTTLEWVIKLSKDIAISSIGDQSSANVPKLKFFDSKGKLVHTARAGYT